MKITKSLLQDIITEELKKMDEDWGQFDREIVVQGYGRLTVKQVKDQVAERLENIASAAASGDFKALHHAINSGVLMAMYEALRDNDALEPRQDPDEVDPDWERN